MAQIVQIGLKGSKWIDRIQMGPWIPLYTSCLALAFLGNFGQGAHDDVWRYIVPCGGERLALQSLIPRHWIHPTFQGQPVIILPSSSHHPHLTFLENRSIDKKRTQPHCSPFHIFESSKIEPNLSATTQVLWGEEADKRHLFLSSSSAASLTSSVWEWDMFHMYGSIHESELPAQEWARQVTPSAAYYSCRPLPGSPRGATTHPFGPDTLPTVTADDLICPLPRITVFPSTS